jgi:hypothetical protein
MRTAPGSAVRAPESFSTTSAATADGPGNPYGNDGCAYCVLANKARHPLTGSDGDVSDRLLPVLDALTQTASPYKQIHWIENGPNALLRWLSQQNTQRRHLVRQCAVQVVSR